jgi:hypothetical protein
LKNKLIISYWIVILANISITVKTYKYLGLADGSLAALMRRSAICSNEVQQYRHRSTQLIHDLSSCLSLAMSNRLSSRRPSIWSEERTTCGSRGSMSNQTRNQLQSLSPILNSHDTYICCSYSPRCFIIQKVINIFLCLFCVFFVSFSLFEIFLVSKFWCQPLTTDWQKLFLQL